MASSARLTLGYPLTFKTLGDVLWSFEGWALRELVNFRRRSISNFFSNLRSFSNCIEGPSKIWVGCPATKAGSNLGDDARLPFWLYSGLWTVRTLPGDKFAQTIPTAAQLCDDYLHAFQGHVKDKDCLFCLRVHALEGEKYCEE